MISDLDIDRSAWFLPKHHGLAAVEHAATRAGELHENGDVAGVETWLRIIAAIQRMRMPTGEPLQ